MTLCCTTRGMWAHPRSRGENFEVLRGHLSVSGSSPLTRGKPADEMQWQIDQGLIPAHAGKTALVMLTVLLLTAHPRSRGENRVALRYQRGQRGSSPLTRGKPQWGAEGGRLTGLIPAHAGKTPFDRPINRAVAAHPRSRGENLWPNHYGGYWDGSSPLTRGKHFLTCAFTAQIDQILETLELAVSSGSYLIWVACATDAPQDPVRSIGLVLPSSRGAS